MANLLKFGTYVLPSTLYPALEPANGSVPVAKLPRTHGSRTSRRYLEEKVLRVEGGLLKASGSPLLAQLDALKAGLQGLDSLYFEDSRYWRNAQLRDFEVSYKETGYGRTAQVRLGFVTGDPFQYSTTLTNSPTHAISSSPTSFVVTAGGNAPALPKFDLTVGGSGSVSLSATLTNQTTGESFTLVGSVTGGSTISVDCLEQTVLTGSSDSMVLFDGLFPTLAVGSNTIQVSFSSGTLSNVGVSWRDRWY